MRRKKRQELTDGEWTILEVVWQREPCAAPTVQEVVEGGKKWAYSTVKTMMDRMVRKGLLRTEKIRNLILYRSAISRAEAQRGEVLRTVKRAFRGALTPMMQFLLEAETLTEADLDEIEALIRKRRKG